MNEIEVKKIGTEIIGILEKHQASLIESIAILETLKLTYFEGMKMKELKK